ncbi:hypothetical protein OVA24_16465 [Luteolibacter sp. SL250]|uniref:hypothetical protein n=1 Tax=Luteolibacter sp. SL250 TaxID=2995170 RepID=UPI002271BA3C|nr:hypothetical protein [Luteolibacter sp. SL250]WAC18825.1 hypothetical protein OVA24_16465 [Luteolibacter sp. SL250]
MRPILTAALLSAAIPSHAPAAVRFNAEFEPGSKWFTETWSAAARAEMQAFLTDLGAVFDSDAVVRVSINDNETVAYASAGSTWSQYHRHAETGGQVSAPGLWLIIVKGMQRPSAASDVTLSWNLDVNALYSGSSGALINNIRGLGRHEMHHAFGASSSLFLDATSDPRGKWVTARLVDTLYRDQNGNAVLGAPDSLGISYRVNSFPLAANWQNVRNQTGLYFEARDRHGRVVKMPPVSGPGGTNGSYIDFSHISGIAYANDHPSWTNIETTDLNFLRAMGYPLAVDAPLRERLATVTAFGFSAPTGTLTCNSRTGHHYRVATSRDLVRWAILPAGKPGTGAALSFPHPIDRTANPRQFYQVVEIPE